MTAHSENSLDPTTLDQLTGGAITATTALARTQLIKAWLESSPTPSYEQLNEVFKLLSAKDKGAARQVRESMDEIKKAQNQESLTQLWSDKANVLLSTSKLNIADAMAWQRDAAKEGAPISKEPLATLRGALAERVKTIEDLQHRAQVQREAAVLIAQRIEVLSTKYWEEAQSLESALASDVARWSAEQESLLSQKDWTSVDPKYTPALLTSAEHLKLVWEAFSAALRQAALSAADISQSLPAVPAWADQIKQKRAEASGADPKTVEGHTHPSKKKMEIDPALKAQAKKVMHECMDVLEKELSQGHGKASAGAAANLRQAIKEYAHVIDQRVERHAQSLLLAAGELEGWQRWRADQIRAELVAKAEGLLQRVKPSVEIKGSKSTGKKSDRQKIDSPQVTLGLSPQLEDSEGSQDKISVLGGAEALANHQPDDQVDLPSTGDDSLIGRPAVSETAVSQPPESSSSLSNTEGSSANSATIESNKNKPNPDYVPTMGPRKLQETLRKLREDWKQTDQGGMPNHALWKRFDNACNLAYPFVHEWLQQTRAQSQAHKTQRLELIAEVKAWTELHSNGPDWRAVQRQLHEFSEKWRACGHVSEKVFAELQVLWKETIHLAHLPIDTLQSQSITRRKALIEESKILGAQPVLKIEPIKALQQRWQDESHVVPIDRKLAQRLWDEFKKPLDEAFQRKSAERAQVVHAMSAHDELVLAASKALEQAIAEADAGKIKAAMHHLQEVSLKGDASVNAKLKDEVAPSAPAPATGEPEGSQSTLVEENLHNPTQGTLLDTPDPSGIDLAHGAVEQTTHETPPPVQASAPTPKPPKTVVAVRGDDRPGVKKDDARPGADQRGRSGFGSSRGKDSAGSRDARSPRDSKSGGAARPGQLGHARDFRESRDSRENRGPRLGDAAFRAQRNALEAAEAAMRKLAAQAHGQTLTNLMSAWKDKNPELVPPLKELGSRINSNQRAAWTKAIQMGAERINHEALLRLEMAANAPTPASDLQARRNLQLQLLTKRNDPTPVQTWAEDTAGVLSGPYDPEVASRLQTVLKTMLKH